MTYRAVIFSRLSLYIALAIGLLATAMSYLFLPPPGTAEAATPGTVTYTYDSVGRIRGDANSTGNSGAYVYDAAGNRTTMTLN